MLPIFGVLRVPQNMAGNALAPPTPHPPKKCLFGLRWSARRQERHLATAPVATGVLPTPRPRASGSHPPEPPKPRGTPGVVKHSSGLPEFWEAPAAGPRSGSGDAGNGGGAKGAGQRRGHSPPKSSPAGVTACTRSEGCWLMRNWSFNYKTGE